MFQKTKDPVLEQVKLKLNGYVTKGLLLIKVV